MRSSLSKLFLAGTVSLLGALSFSHSWAQEPAAAPAPAAPGAAGRGGRANRPPPEMFYINKTKGGIYTPPMRPLWKLSDLLQMHAGQNNWSQQIIKDNLQDVTYNSAAPGTKVIPRMHMETATVFVVIKGEMHFTVEGQQPVTATRGGIVNILSNTIYSYDVEGSQNALWVELHPLWYQTEYPATEPPPPALPGTDVVKVSFPRTPSPYTGNNKLYFNLFDALAACQPVGNVVIDEHIYVNPLLGYVNPADNKCGTGAGNIGSGPDKPGDPPFNPKSVYGHLHHGVIEWWIVQSGAISGKFENAGEFHAVEGDVLYAAPDMWHQMAAEALSGPSVRTAVGGYNINNMNNTAAPAAGR
jgi:mannose-6-phosphate isomerase-like protein (cupin superfamily)